MGVQALGYIGIGRGDLETWSGFATRQLGMQQVEGGRASRSFRMDDRKQRIIVDAEGERYFGWEVADAAALEALGARLEAAGTAVTREPAALADRRCVTGLISFRDPEGHRLEAFHGPQLAEAPFQPGRNVSGFKAGALGLGHAVLMVETDHGDFILDNQYHEIIAWDRTGYTYLRRMSDENPNVWVAMKEGAADVMVAAR